MGGEKFSHWALFFLVSGSEDSLHLVQVMTEIAAHKDYEISSITFNFWHDLSDTLVRG